MSSKIYMAASVPRFLRQTRLGYLPLHCVIGSRLVQGDGGANLYFDIVMLPVQEFQRMRTNIGLQHVVAPALQAGPSFTPSFILSDAKKVIVPETEANPENYARNYFLKLFKLSGSEENFNAVPRQQIPAQSPFAQAAEACTHSQAFVQARSS